VAASCSVVWGFGLRRTRGSGRALAPVHLAAPSLCPEDLVRACASSPETSRGAGWPWNPAYSSSEPERSTEQEQGHTIEHRTGNRGQWHKQQAAARVYGGEAVAVAVSRRGEDTAHWRVCLFYEVRGS
jgi:hypothetical protein